MQPNVIIDGNNLAQIKYSLQGKPVTIEYDRAIIRALAAWAECQREACPVDLFLDPRMVIPERAGRVFVHVAEPGEKADPHIKDYVRHCVMSKKPCIVITDDDDLTDYACKQGAGVINVSEFIKFPNFLNLPSSDFEKESYPYLINISPEPGVSQLESGFAMRASVNPFGKRLQKINSIAAPGLLDVHQRTYQRLMNTSEREADHHTENALLDGDPIPVNKQMVRLNLDRWPLEDGFQVLTKMICSQHKKEYQSLLGKPNNALPADLHTYYHFVLELCGAEQDFYARGANLMDNVRLALMKVHPNGLVLAELEKLFGDNPGFRHKINVHNGKSIELFEIAVLEG